MSLKSLTIQNFRNHESFQIQFDANISIFTGQNGVGKTSLLEAIAVLGTSRSFRTTTNLELIRSGSVSGHLRAYVDMDELDHDIRIEILPKSKKISVNQKRIARRRQILKILPSIIFSPQDHRIIEGDASERRLFLDRAISNVDFEYADVLTQYKKVITQRNKLLKACMGLSIEAVQSQLEPWDVQLLALGTQVVKCRAEYLQEMQENISEQYRKISGKNHVLRVVYQPLGSDDFPRDEELDWGLFGEKFGEKIRARRALDLIRGTSSVGPHKDEMGIYLNEEKLKAFGSQGERRSAALALRLGEVEMFRKHRKRDPILLLDDVSSELDASRRKALVDLLRATKTQVLITATEFPADIVSDLSFSHWDLNSRQRVQ